MAAPVISVAQMREWEKASWAAGRTEGEVIARVGQLVAERAMSMTRAGDSILILAGKGHNGDDARAALGHFQDRRVQVLTVKDPEAAMRELHLAIEARPALVVDGLFGIGINRPLDAQWIELIELVNDSGRAVLAVDVPSGLNADTGRPEGAAIRATVTQTLAAPKAGMLKEEAWPYVGRLEVAHEIGLVNCPVTSETSWVLANDFDGFPPPRPVASHKGDYGRLAIVAGSLGYHGAGVLTARGAQRAQAGLITLFTQENIYQAVAPQLQAVMVHLWRQDVKLPGDFDALLIGPGLAAADLPEDLKGSVESLWRDAPVPMVVDASALDWLPRYSSPSRSDRVVTPHPGEAARLLRTTTAQVQGGRPAALRQISSLLGDCWVVLKGHQTLVGRSTGLIRVNSSGNPHLAQGGSGDLLAGYLAGLLAQRALRGDMGETLCYGVWQHGAAADRLTASRNNWIVEDLAAELGNP